MSITFLLLFAESYPNNISFDEDLIWTEDLLGNLVTEDNIYIAIE